MRRIIIIMVLAVLAVITAQSAYSQDQMVYVSAPTVNLRSGPGEQYGVIQVVRSGNPLKVINIQDNWYQVKSSGGVVGWIARGAVNTEKPQSAQIGELKTLLSTRESELSRIKNQLDQQVKLNAQLLKQASDSRQAVEGLNISLHQAERGEYVKLALIGTMILLLGSLFGFLIGYFRRQAEDKRFIKMMVETESARKSKP